VTRTFIGKTIIFLLAFIGSLSGTDLLQASVFWGAEASGSGRQFEITCGTCPNTVTNFGTQSDGGFGAPLAVVEFSSGVDVSYLGEAVFRGTDFLPRLAVQANGNIKIEAPSTFFYSASSTARATQEYTYIGTTSSNYTLEYNLDGTFPAGS
jgi:hypothetical protein